MKRIFSAALAALTLLGTSAQAMTEISLDPFSPSAEVFSAANLAYPIADTDFDIFEVDPADFPLGQPVEVIPPVRPKLRPEGIYEKSVLNRLPTTLVGASDFMCMAVAIYHEARGETLEGQAAVASVILQRVRVPRRWGDTVCDVVAPVQFSFLKDDLSYAAILEYDAWMTALDIATVAMVEGPDPWLEDADHYHTTGVDPDWNEAMPVVARIGEHIFYADPLSQRRLKRAGLSS
jgi:hypothetical protein